MPIINCPNCDHEQSVPRELIGLRATCRECKEEFTVDDGSGGPGKSTRRRIDLEPVNVGAMFRSVKLLAGLVVLVGIVIGIAYLLISSKRNAEKEKETAKNVVAKLPPEAIKQKDTESAATVEHDVRAAAGVGFILFVFALLCVYAFLLVTMGAWVAKDANARGMPGLGWASFYYLFHFFSRVLIFGLSILPALLLIGLGLLVIPIAEIVSWMGLFAYLYARRPGRLSPCRECGNRRLVYLAKCPHCSK